MPAHALAVVLLCPAAAAAEGQAADLSACRQLAEPAARLHCYDALPVAPQPPRFQGRLTETTPPFAVDGPALLRYQSDGPIFVMALKTVDGAIVQNLHLGGGGEGRYLIARPGSYVLQISGSETWRVWVEPQPATR